MKKKILLILVFVSIFGVCEAQEWMTSFHIAKRLALKQNKMLLVMWEDAYKKPYPEIVTLDNGTSYLIEDILSNEYVNYQIWELFVPVILKEYEYEDLYNEIKGKRSLAYITRFNDDTIKIMDVNDNILNVYGYDYKDFLSYLKSYALDTSFLKNELINYKNEKSLVTSFRLASRYIDFSIYADKRIKNDMIKLANIYLEEAKAYLAENNPNNKIAIQNRISLIEIEQYIILNQHRKAKRKLKQFEYQELEKLNQPLFAFLNYTIMRLLNDDDAQLWKDKVKVTDLKKAGKIINNNIKASASNN